MKTTLLILVISLLGQLPLASQSCLPGGIIFSTQSDIDNFQVNYPNCTDIEGNVTICLNDITNLNGLNVLTHIGGDLAISGALSLTSLTGLEGLTSISGDLIIGGNYLTNLTGLNGLSSIEGKARIINNGNLITLAGLDALAVIGGEFWICDNQNLENLTGLGALDSIDGYLLIYRNNNLTSLAGLSSLTSINGYLDISENFELTDLTALLSLKSINGGLAILSNQALISLSGIDSINPNSISDLQMTFNSYLSTCEVKSVCEYLSNPNASSQINNNNNGCNSKAQILDACESLDAQNVRPEELLSVYPNPCEQFLFIKTDKLLTRGNISLYDILGQRIQNYQFTNNILDVSGLEKGVYVLSVNFDQTIVQRKICIE